MKRYIDLNELVIRIKKYVKAENSDEKELVEWCTDECIRQAYCMPTADVAPKSEVKTWYDRIKAMPFDELVSFFVYLEGNGIIATADKHICGKCKKEHGGRCPIKGDEDCPYNDSAKETIKRWLEGEAYG